MHARCNNLVPGQTLGGSRERDVGGGVCSSRFKTEQSGDVGRPFTIGKDDPEDVQTGGNKGNVLSYGGFPDGPDIRGKRDTGAEGNPRGSELASRADKDVLRSVSE